MLRTSPDSALVRINLGLTHYHLGDVERALAEFRAAVELTPDFALARSNLAVALERQGHDEQALRH